MTDTETSQTKPAKDDPIATAILDALADANSLRFKDVAMRIADVRKRPKDRPDLWRTYMTAVKQQAIHFFGQIL